MLLGSARLGDAGPPIAVDAAAAIARAGLGAASEATLVWLPCRASLSPLYPIWRVSRWSRNCLCRPGGRGLAHRDRPRQWRSIHVIHATPDSPSMMRAVAVRRSTIGKIT
jgi:hypothetical protein